MPNEIEQFAEQIHGTYHHLLTCPDSRVDRGQSLWKRFETALSVYRNNGGLDDRPITEAVNELVVAKLLLDDHHITANIMYEPNILPNKQKIDFVVPRKEEFIYIEVKTVHPRVQDNKQAWQNYLQRKEHHPENIKFIVDQKWMGGAIYGNTFSSRSHFLKYTREFETRLDIARSQKPGPGILVFCNSGLAWRLTDLEDFVDFYHSGVHRQDDAFALMEQHNIEHNDLQILRNIDHFSYVKRAVTFPEKEQFIFSVKGLDFELP